MDCDEVFNRQIMYLLFTETKNGPPKFHNPNIPNNNVKIKDSIISIECDCPEIGTKIENMNQMATNLKNYYENNIKNMFFYPFFDMNKGHNNKNNKFKIAYFIEDLYDLFLFKHSKEEEVKIQIKNKTIIQIIYNKVQDKIELYFFLKSPPKVYVKDNKMSPTNYIENFQKSLNNYTYDNLYRNVDQNIPIKYFVVKHHKIINKKMNNNIVINLVNNDPHFQREVSYFSRDNEFENLYLNDLIIKISFKNNKKNKEFFKSLKMKMKNMKIKVKNNKYYYEKIKSVNSEQRKIIDNILVEKKNKFYFGFQKLIPNLQFALMSLLTVQQINIFNFSLDILTSLYCVHTSMQENVVKRIEELTKSQNYTNIFLDYQTFMKDYKSLLSIKNENNNTEKTKSITITPSKIIYNISTQSTTNHFQRKLKIYNDNIIKFNIVDEDNNSFSNSDINKSNKLLLFIKSIFKNGITLGFSHYEYIGCSNSQQKNLGGWMINLEGIRIYKEEYLREVFKNEFKIRNIISQQKEIYFSRQKYNNCEEIINLFGDFSKEKNIFKHTSRKGMIFSDSKYVTDINIYNVLPLEDEKIGEYIITDGIGKISSDLINLSAKKWGITNLKLKPISAIQIRFNGCKGVFALDPFLQENTVHYRESQKKFESDDIALNVCSVANYKEACLNRQFIILLSSLGVKDEIFEKIEEDIIKKYSEMLIDANKALSSDKSLYYEFKSILLRFIPVFEYLFKNKISLLDDPLISQFINIFVYSKLINIKYNGKLNDKRCVCLMGVLDETNTLEENQVYVHLVHSTEYCRINKILNQKITVYRSPSLYPGDIKILNAVNNPNLSHMVNVIVFSKKGQRPTFNKLSGGDLDGDRYFISFNDYITTNIKDTTCEPLEDPKYSIKNNNINNINQINKKITIDDTINCIITSVQNDLVGLICDNHMALADNFPLKAKDPKCIKLCKYFNQEIDAPKNGNFIKMTTLQEEHLIMKKRPDFLSNGILNKNTIYNSPGILGKLYRQIDRKIFFEKFRQNFFDKAIRRNYEINIKYITNDCFKYLSDAYLIYEKYQIMICKLMKRYNFCTEGELFLNMRIFKNNRAYRGKSDSYIVELNNIIDYINKEIIQVFKNIDLNVASAIYVASYINLKKICDNNIGFTEYYMDNIGILLSLFEEEKNEFKMKFNDYQDYNDLKHSHKDYKNRYKRIFSLPWVIKDIRNLLMNL